MTQALQVQALIAGTGLGLAALGLLLVLLKKPAHHDPHNGVAQGCLGILLIALLALGAMLAVGVTAGVPLLVKIAFYIVILPLVLMLIHGVRYIVMKVRDRNEE